MKNSLYVNKSILEIPKKKWGFSGKITFYIILKKIRNTKNKCVILNKNQLASHFPKTCNFPRMIQLIEKIPESLFEKIEYDHSEKNITFVVNDQIMKNLEISNQSVKIDLDLLNKLNVLYEFRAYEFFTQYKDDLLNGFEIEIEDFRKYFEVPIKFGFGGIKSRVIDSIVKMINEYTEYTITFKKIHLDKITVSKITHLKIKIEVK